VNIVALLYIRWLINIINVINQDIKSLSDMIEEFSTHLKSVYELEMFYGDDTLKSLMDHASQLSERLEDLDLVVNEERKEEVEAEEEEA
tara:strand:- start:2172 stop:2438 length:267 start_codon:yes stop_codon:yes gene_type:complete